MKFSNSRFRKLGLLTVLVFILGLTDTSAQIGMKGAIESIFGLEQNTNGNIKAQQETTKVLSKEEEEDVIKYNLSNISKIGKVNDRMDEVLEGLEENKEQEEEDDEEDLLKQDLEEALDSLKKIESLLEETSIMESGRLWELKEEQENLIRQLEDELDYLDESRNQVLDQLNEEAEKNAAEEYENSTVRIDGELGTPESESPNITSPEEIRESILEKHRIAIAERMLEDPNLNSTQKKALRDYLEKAKAKKQKEDFDSYKHPKTDKSQKGKEATGPKKPKATPDKGKKGKRNSSSSKPRTKSSSEKKGKGGSSSSYPRTKPKSGKKGKGNSGTAKPATKPESGKKGKGNSGSSNSGTKPAPSSNNRTNGAQLNPDYQRPERPDRSGSKNTSIPIELNQDKEDPSKTQAEKEKTPAIVFPKNTSDPAIQTVLKDYLDDSASDKNLSADEKVQKIEETIYNLSDPYNDSEEAQEYQNGKAESFEKLNPEQEHRERFIEAYDRLNGVDFPTPDYFKKRMEAFEKARRKARREHSRKYDEGVKNVIRQKLFGN